MNRKRNNGQALIEYLLVFAFMSMISLKLAQNFGSFLAETTTGLGNALTSQLMTGICENSCYYFGYYNK